MRDTDNEIYLSVEDKTYKPYLLALVTILMVLMQVLSSLLLTLTIKQNINVMLIINESVAVIG